MTYIERIIEPVIKEFIGGLPAVSIVGAKGVGKTSTAKLFAKTVLNLDTSEPERVIASSKESMAALDNYPILVDEWSRAPQSWDVIRRLVDDDYLPGRFILTGSSTQKISISIVEQDAFCRYRCAHCLWLSATSLFQQLACQIY